MFRSHWIGVYLLLVFVLLANACGERPPPSEDPTAPPDIFIEFSSYKELQELFIELDYTPEAWAEGAREVPRLYMTNIPSRWRSTTAAEVSVAEKKALFFRLMSPGVMKINELIEIDRSHLQELMTHRDSLTAEEAQWLAALAQTYRVPPAEPPTQALYDELLLRVDIIPPSLVLAQSAEESGWGTSRFADLGNALFGQWTWDEGIAPLERREGRGNYSIASFDTPLDSIRAYMLNLNTHGAYEELRERRHEMRLRHEQPTGWELARTLTRYSERGDAYVETLHTIMRVNALAAVDEAYLAEMAPITLVAIGEGSQ